MQFCVLVILDVLIILCLQDGQAMLWDLNEGKHLYTLDGGDVINALCFSPNRYWLCAATGPSIKIWVPSALCPKHTVSDWTYVFILAGWCPFGHALTS